MKLSPEELLFDYYQRSFPQILGISFPVSVDTQNRYSTLAEYLLELPSDLKLQVEQRLLLYIERIASEAKTKPLREYLGREQVKNIRHLLDFGCGTGNLTISLALQLKEVEVVYGIDEDVTVLPKANSFNIPEKLTAVWVKTISETYLQKHTCDLIVAVDSMHHVPLLLQNDVIGNLLSLLTQQGLIYIYEDSWDDKRFLSTDVGNLDYIFSAFSREEKLQLYELNEYWSNTWCYGRSLDSHPSRYRPINEWKEFLIDMGGTILDWGTCGFNYSRLHGVPSAWLIAASSEKM